MAAETNAGQDRHIRVALDLDALVDEALAFVTLPWPRAHPTAALVDLGSVRNRWIPIPILEQMVLDGVRQRRDVAAFLAAVFDPQQFEVR